MMIREQALKYYLHLNQRQTEGERRTAGKTEKEKNGNLRFKNPPEPKLTRGRELKSQGKII